MRIPKIMPITMILCVVGVLLSSCASEPEPTAEIQEATVQRGNLVIDVTGVGNLALSQKEDLAFAFAPPEVPPQDNT